MEPFKLPPLTRLMLADVDAGSDTPSLVGKVLKWRKEDSKTGMTRNVLPPPPSTHPIGTSGRPMERTG